LRDYTAARRSAARLSGLRRSELSAVIASVDRLAATGQLSAGRLGPVFLLLRRNRQFWTRYAKLPAPSARITFGSDPAIFQYYPGRGMQLQQLASWGRINAMLHNCQIGRRCPTGLLRYSLNKLVRQAAPRGGFLAWESYFPFGGSSSPWISGMTQGTAVQALARGARVLHAPRYLRVAERSLGAFQTPPPLGVAVPAPGGTHYLMYSFAPGLRILNGDLQAITGLRDLAALGGSWRARRLYRRGDGAARRLVARYDTGAWSLYSLGGRESSLGYHKLVTEFLGNLCDRSGGHPYCAAHRRFAAYLRQPPRIHIARLVRLRMHRATTVRFTLSKVSGVAVRVTGPQGVSLYRRLTLTRGAHTLGWTPPARGIYHVQVVAQGPSGPRGSARETVRVTLPLPKPHHRQRKGSRAASKQR
jgi:hypothetical protein